MAPPSSNSSAATTSVQVALRIRPTTKQDATSIPSRFQRAVIHAISNQVVAVDPITQGQAANGNASAPAGTPGKKQTFAFDQVHGPETTQFDLFQSTASPLIPRFLEGFNCTILAYGQTSSGKTFSMTGIDLDADPTNPYNGMGIIPRSIYSIFSQAAAMKEDRGGAWTYNIKGSFIELYNEELIDLLSYDDVGGGRREVQIREDKHGHIIWDGLREVAVRNVNEVMTLIRQGTSIRRTNETDMNAQSSRSHAIFSLTLTQRKYTGSGVPPRSSTPVASSGGRSPSRLARPVSHQYTGSGNSRVSSPTFGRPPTPSFASAMGRGGGLRPSSAMGSHTPDGKAKNVEDDSGEWMTVVSKFHFVDLAGSERLKRTAAAGERVKEGISINSGLLALGNVISALGDPSRLKSHTASHIPYRDSKLTRLLQDSLGGNAHTLMIACVSPAEWNANETVNTLKYANRARNIKNRAVVNEREEGWDDLEWLQSTVTRLRKELKSLKDGGAISVSSGEPIEVEGASKKVLTQMVQLQSNYEDLRGKFVERTEELTRLRQELGERYRSSTSGTISGTAKYEEIVGPVIEEYEKTISAMEAELSLNRAALRHTNDLVEEKEEELSQLQDRHSATELYLEELKARVGKLSEREASTEAYIRDLEEKIKQQEDSTISSSESVSDLKREILRIKDSEGRSAQYISELEARLSRADESILSLRAQVERLEEAAEVKQEEARTLQVRLSGILTDGESWRSDLEEREKRVRDLEQKMEEWEAKRKAAGEDRARIGEINKEVQQARRSLEVDMAEAAKAIKIVHPDSSAAASDAGDESDASLQNQLDTLRETHAATLADLSSVSAKYRDALKEISDLAGQIDEIKLGSPSSRSDSPERNMETPPPTTRRRAATRAREIGINEVNGAGRKLFFRQAASAESLRSRSQSQSQSLSQELFSARSRMLSSPDTANSPFVNGHANRSPGGLRPNLSISLPIGPGHEQRSVQSLEKEIMRLQEVLKEREVEITSLETALKAKERELVVNGEANGYRSSNASSLSPRMKDQFDAIRKSMEIRAPSDLVTNNEPIDRLNELMLSMALKEAAHKEEVEEVNEELKRVSEELSKKIREHDDLTKLSRDQTLNMSTELDALRSVHDQSVAALEELRRKEAELLEERKTVEAKHEEELKRIQQDHEQLIRDKQSEVDALLGNLKAKHEEALRGKQAELDSLLTGSAAEHSKALATKESEMANQIATQKAEHEAALLEVHKQLAGASESLTKAQRDHEEAFGKLKNDHEEELRKLKEDVDQTLSSVKEGHEAAIAKLTADHANALKEKEDILSRTEEEYYAALSKLRADHADVLSKKEADAAAAIERLKEEHVGALKMAELAREGSLTESQSQQADLLKQLQTEHSSAIEKKEAIFAEDLQRVKDEHATAMEKKQLDHSSSVERLKSKHASRLAELEESKNLEIEALQKTLSATHEQHDSARSVLLKEKEKAIEDIKEQHSTVLAEMARSHEEIINTLKTEHQGILASTAASHQEELQKLQRQHADVLSELEKMHEVSLENLKGELAASLAAKSELETSSSQLSDIQEQMKASHQESLDALLKEKTEEILKLKSEHQQSIAQLENAQIAALDQHQQDLENARAQSNALLAEERERVAKVLTEAEAEFAVERETLRKDVELLQEDVASYKAVAEEYTSTQNETRQAHSHALEEKDKVIVSLKEASEAAQVERLRQQAEMEQLRKELESTRAESLKMRDTVAIHSKVVAELERHRTLLTDVQKDLQKARDQKDSLLSERTKQDVLIRDLQAQLARSPVHDTLSPPLRPTPDRNGSFQRANGMSKLPPLTPPPSVPPPPAPKSIPPLPSSVPLEATASISTVSTTLRSSGSSHEDLGSPATSIASTHAPAVDPAISARLEEQQRHIDEQEVMIKTLNKQLTHCESDLQVHMDLVGQLETSLGDSEKNLRKARMQATEISRERDALNMQIDRLRKELDESKREVTAVRRSVVEEKQSLESRLEEERRAKDRVRQQLDMRVEELQRRKSKFVCL